MKYRGFTLVELLVVISIIGVLSTIVLASLNTARTKAYIASGLQYEANMQHAIADWAVIWWKFDSDSNDISGRGNNASFTGSETYTNERVNTGKNMSLSLNGSTFASVADNSTLSVGAGKSFLWMAWIRPTDVSGTRTIISKGTSALSLINGVVTWSIPLSGGQTGLVSGPTIPINTWTHVAGNYASDGTARLYVNGKSVGASAASGVYANAVSSPFMVGAATGPANYFQGQIDDVVFFNESLGVN